jgi:hypothetical protein
MPWPNFLVIGAARCGTTSLYHYLGQHPAIYMSPKKEPNFFAFAGETTEGRGAGFQKMVMRSRTTPSTYLALFDGVTTETRYGEASVRYMVFPRTIINIRRYAPTAKLIAVLRDPVERAYSHFLLHIRDKKEPIQDFDRALAAEPARLREDWKESYQYAGKGFYYRQLRPYFDAFPREQLRVYLHEDLCNDAAGLMRDIFRFLEVDEDWNIDTRTAHGSSRMARAAKNELWSAVALKPNRAHTLARRMLPVPMRESLKRRLHHYATFTPPLRPETRARMIAEYREDILQLQALLGRDLSAWLDPELPKAQRPMEA